MRLRDLVERLVAELDPAVRLTWDGDEVAAEVDGAFLGRASVSGEEREAAAFLAGFVQDTLVEHRGGAALPPCPGHAHPAAPRVTPDGVTWACPAAGC